MTPQLTQAEPPATRVHEVPSQLPSTAYADYVNPEWVRLLDLLGMNVRYGRCSGTELFAEDGRVFLDFLSGYCVHNTGHNHPGHHRGAEARVGPLRSGDAAEPCCGHGWPACA